MARSARQTTKAVAKRPQAEVPAVDYGEDAEGGFENQSRDDYAVPFLAVLQNNSPQVEATGSKLKAGQLLNTVTEEAFSGEDGVAFVPALTQHVFVEWVPREQGGGGGAGFVCVRETDDPVVRDAVENQEFGNYTNPDTKNKLVETFYVYGVMVREDGAVEPMVVGFSSTKIKVYKGWMTKARAIQVAQPDGRRQTPPLFAHRYRLTTVQQQNVKGTFRNFACAFDGADAAACRMTPDDPVYQAARSFRDMVKSGQAKADHKSAEANEGAGDDGKAPF